MISNGGRLCWEGRIPAVKGSQILRARLYQHGLDMGMGEGGVEEAYPFLPYPSVESRRERHFWDHPENRRNQLDRLGCEHQLRTRTDWLSTDRHTLRPRLTGKLSRLYNSSLSQMVQSIYPELHAPLLLKERRSGLALCHLPRGFWDGLDNQVRFLDSVGVVFGIREKYDWKDVSVLEVQAFGGQILIERFHSNMLYLLEGLYPYFYWSRSSQHIMPNGYFSSLFNQERLFEEAVHGDPLFSGTFEYWMSHGRAMLKQYGGYFLNQFGNMVGVLSSIYPEFNWHPLKTKGNIQWKLEASRNFIISNLHNNLGISEKRDWYTISNLQISSSVGRRIQKSRLVRSILYSVPEENWELKEFSSFQKKATQRWLYLCTQNLFPNELILSNYKHPALKYTSGASVELDLYLPQRNLAIEYQGEQHYNNLEKAGFLPLHQRTLLDSQKKEICSLNKIQLIHVPYWWDQKLESLRDMVCVLGDIHV
eukprot:TRINITY_DN3388_c1_g1_i1.p1 TRINITY_DN3388_c1_g1~~TRINITY_DN3388_c1_g1_i1.p1  ORF type:complete len:479 (-),score=72.36 TRINITY_DN3388_c1_g1_i1:7-1443(-)